MPTYEIKFEFFGKKMKTKINANSAKEAENKLRDRISIKSVKMANASNGGDFLDLINYFKAKGLM